MQTDVGDYYVGDYSENVRFEDCWDAAVIESDVVSHSHGLKDKSLLGLEFKNVK